MRRRTLLGVGPKFICAAAVLLLAGPAPAAVADSTVILPGKAGDGGLFVANKALYDADLRARQAGGFGAYLDASTGVVKAVLPADPAVNVTQSAAVFPAGTVVSRSRFDVQTLEKVQAELAGLLTQANDSYAFGYDLQTDTVTVYAPTFAAFAPVIAKYPDMIRLTQMTISRNSRTADAPPHWGGAAITSGGATCTSGFPVYSGSTQYMVTASHCYALGASVSNGGYYWGTVTRRADWPNTDAELISGTAMQGALYADPTATYYPIRGYAANLVGSGPYCLSGRVSKNKCGNTEVAVDQRYCYLPAGCTTGLVIMRGAFAGQGGDSGAPYYAVRSSSAYIVGIDVAAGCGILPNSCQDWVESYSRISSLYGVTLLTF